MVFKNGRRVRIFSALEVANICGVVNQTAINWIRNGYLKAFTTPGGQYRVYAKDLSEFLDKRGMGASEEVLHLLTENVDWNTILVIDSDRDLNNRLKEWMKKNLPGYEIIQALDGFEAGRKLTESRPGFVLLDPDMPGIDGYGLAHKIKEDPCFGKPFVLIMSARVPAPGLGGSKSPGISGEWDAFFPKPLDFDLLLAELRVLEKRINQANTA